MVTQRKDETLSNQDASKTARLPLYFLCLLIIGGIGGLLLRQSAASYVLFHLGAVGLLGISGALAGSLAKKKGFGYTRAFLLGFALPIILGIIGAFLTPPGEGGTRPAACGGSLSLLVAIIVIFTYAFVRRPDESTRAESA